MTLRRVLLILFIAAGAAALVRAYSERHADVAKTSEDDKPVAGASRLRQENGQAVIVLDSVAKRRVDILLVQLQAARSGGELILNGEIIADPQGVSTIRSPVAGRLIEAGRPWPSFGERVEAGQELAQVSDAKPLAAQKGGEVVRVLAQPGELVSAGQELLVIVDFDHPLGRLAWPSGAPGTPPRSIVLAIPGAESRRVLADLVGASTEADPLTRRPAYLYRAQAPWAEARPGTAIVGLMPRSGRSADAVLVPASAVVQWEGLAWVYLESGPDQYARTALATDRPVPGGYLADGQLKRGDRVVVRGAAQLLSEEFRARITVGEEVGE